MTAEPARAAPKVFVVEGTASPQLPLRLLNFFAQQNLLPDSVSMIRSSIGLVMRIADSTLDEHRAAVILAKMQALPDVATATLGGVAVPSADAEWNRRDPDYPARGAKR